MSFFDKNEASFAKQALVLTSLILALISIFLFFSKQIGQLLIKSHPLVMATESVPAGDWELQQISILGALVTLAMSLLVCFPLWAHSAFATSDFHFSFFQPSKLKQSLLPYDHFLHARIFLYAVFAPGFIVFNTLHFGQYMTPTHVQLFIALIHIPAVVVGIFVTTNQRNENDLSSRNIRRFIANIGYALLLTSLAFFGGFSFWLVVIVTGWTTTPHDFFIVNAAFVLSMFSASFPRKRVRIQETFLGKRIITTYHRLGSIPQLIVVCVLAFAIFITPPSQRHLSVISALGAGLSGSIGEFKVKPDAQWYFPEEAFTDKSQGKTIPLLIKLNTGEVTKLQMAGSSEIITVPNSQISLIRVLEKEK